MRLHWISTSLYVSRNVHVLRANLPGVLTRYDTVIARDSSRIKWRACRTDKRRDRGAFVYINQFVCPVR